MEKTDWFISWFDTSYYHILYKDRNDQDAQLFMKNITEFLKLSKDSHILDLPCGKGRHAIYLNSLGYKVTGGDLSENSIKYAKQFENKNLKFRVKDMRQPFNNNYNAVFNLFTSFGYFDNDEDEILVLKNMKQGLLNSGILVLDFLNVMNIKDHLIDDEIKTVDGIDFHIQRKITDEFILKHIHFQDKGKEFSYTEQVKRIELHKFTEFFTAAGLTVKNVFGDYHLNEFDEKKSDRLILIAE